MIWKYVLHDLLLMEKTKKKKKKETDSNEILSQNTTDSEDNSQRKEPVNKTVRITCKLCQVKSLFLTHTLTSFPEYNPHYKYFPRV